MVDLNAARVYAAGWCAVGVAVALSCAGLIAQNYRDPPLQGAARSISHSRLVVAVKCTSCVAAAAFCAGLVPATIGVTTEGQFYALIAARLIAFGVLSTCQVAMLLLRIDDGVQVALRCQWWPLIVRVWHILLCLGFGFFCVQDVLQCSVSCQTTVSGSLVACTVNGSSALSIEAGVELGVYAYALAGTIIPIWQQRKERGFRPACAILHSFAPCLGILIAIRAMGLTLRVLQDTDSISGLFLACSGSIVRTLIMAYERSSLWMVRASKASARSTSDYAWQTMPTLDADVSHGTAIASAMMPEDANQLETSPRQRIGLRHTTTWSHTDSLPQWTRQALHHRRSASPCSTHCSLSRRSHVLHSMRHMAHLLPTSRSNSSFARMSSDHPVGICDGLALTHTSIYDALVLSRYSLANSIDQDQQAQARSMHIINMPTLPIGVDGHVPSRSSSTCL